MSMDWLKLHHDARRDAKLATLTDAQYRVWMNGLIFASEQETRGTIPAMKERVLALEIANGNVEILRETIAALVDLDIIATGEGGSLTYKAFAKRNARKPSDDPEAAAARQRRSRENRSKVESDEDMSRDVTRGHALDKREIREDPEGEGGRACARMTPAPQDAPSGELPEGDVASSENTGLDRSVGQVNDRERAAAALGSAAARHQRQLSAHKRAAGWSFTEADRALLIDAGEALGIEASQLPGEVGHRLARGDGPAYERWYELPAPEVAAWCAKAVTAAARAGKLEVSYVAGIIRQRLEANRPAPGEPAGNVVAFPAASPPPPPPEPYRDRPWGSFFYAVKGIPERDRLRDVARNLEENYRWPVDEAIALAKFDAEGLVAGMDYLWSCRPAEGAAS